jgi:hypothetical protein
MSAKDCADDVSATVHYALETTRAVAVCPFHSEVTIRVGDDAAERANGPAAGWEKQPGAVFPFPCAAIGGNRHALRLDA